MTAAKDELYGDQNRRPPRPKFDGKAIPAALRALPQWVCWRFAWKAKDGKWTKLPLNPREWCRTNARSNDPTTWADLTTTAHAAKVAAAQDPARVDGLGFMFADGGGLFGLDIDGCRDPETGALSELGRTLVERFNTYTEVSPSGTGVKLIGRGTLSGKGRKAKFGDGQELEAYCWGRYFTITGDRVPGTPEDVTECSAALSSTVAEQFASAASAPAPVVVGAALSDSDIIDLLTKKAKNAAEGARLWNGDTSAKGGDDSSADLALCNLLAFYCGPDPDRIDSLFRQSGLMREKWDRSDYRASTINKALEGRTEFFDRGGRARIGTSAGLKRGKTGRFQIVVTNNEYEVNTKVIGALVEDCDIFVRAGSLVRVIQEPGGEHRGCMFPPGPRILTMSGPSIRDYVSRAVEFMQTRAAGTPDEKLVPTHPPEWVVGGVRDRGVWPGARHLQAVVDHPIVAPDGSIIATAGFAPSVEVFVNPIGLELDVPDEPTRADAVSAAAVLDEVIADFPFGSEAHRAAWLAGLLTPLARFAFAGPSPLFIADGNVRGSGKGLLCDTISLIVTGKPFATSAFTADDDEMRKRITALAMEGERMVLLDNISGRFGGSSLDRALTSTLWKDRELGKSKVVEFPLWATWYGTGNNVQMDGDTARRVCRMRLESPLETPEDRIDFRHSDLRRWILDERPRLLSAALTILTAYMRAGRPKSKDVKPWGSYEGWSDLIRECVVWLGRTDPGVTRQESRDEGDNAAEAMETIVRNWHLLDPTGSGVTANAILKRVFPKDGRTEEVMLDIADALATLQERPTANGIGHRLKHFRLRNFAGRRLERLGKSNGSVRWVVRPVPGSAQANLHGASSDEGDKGLSRRSPGSVLAELDDA